MGQPRNGALLSGRVARVGAADDVLARLMQLDFVAHALVSVKHPVADLRILPTLLRLIGVVNAEGGQVLEIPEAVEAGLVLANLVDERPHLLGRRIDFGGYLRDHYLVIGIGEQVVSRICAPRGRILWRHFVLLTELVQPEKHSRRSGDTYSSELQP